jgi:hypothetical protein
MGVEAARRWETKVGETRVRCCLTGPRAAWLSRDHDECWALLSSQSTLSRYSKGRGVQALDAEYAALSVCTGVFDGVTATSVPG